MVMAVGAGSPHGGVFHLATHAAFKALLFLGAGSVIHAVHSQEMPDMGGLRKKMPITFVTFLIATLAIAGVPGFAGFYSKDGILGSTLAFGMEHGRHYVPFVLAIIAAAITPFYMFRIIFMTFTGKPRNQEKFDHAHESPWVMAAPLVILAVLSIIGAGWNNAEQGWFARFSAPYDVPAITAEVVAAHDATGHEVVHHVVEVQSVEVAHGDAYGDEHGDAYGDAYGDSHGEAETHADDHAHDIHHRAHSTAMKLSILAATLGILLSWWTYYLRKIDTAALLRRLRGVYHVLQGQYFFDEFYAATVYRGTLWVAWLAGAFDRVVVDGIVNGFGYLTRAEAWLIGQFDNWIVDGLVNGVATTMQGAGEGFRRIQTGRLQTYLTYVSASVVVLILIYRAL